MVCYTPMQAYRTAGGGITFNPSAGFLDRPLKIKCGQCEGCRLAYSREWAIRCYHESKMHEENVYVTLTYKTPPGGGTLIKDELSKFMHRLRHSQGNGIRFFGCGEYAPLPASSSASASASTSAFGRPHYHAIIFNWKPNDLRQFKKNKSDQWIYTSRQLDKIWGLGHTYSGEATFQSSAYVARYILKKINGAQQDTHYKTVDPETGEITNDVIQEFTTQSLGTKETGGIGKSWYEKFGLTDAHNHDKIICSGRSYPVPRYYDKLLEKNNPARYAAIKLERVRNAGKHAENNTPARLKVRARVQAKKTERLLRDQSDKGNEP